METVPSTAQVVEHPVKHFLSWEDCKTRALANIPPGKVAYGIPRGGKYVSAILAGLGYRVTEDLFSAEILVDDIVDSGKTARQWKEKTGLDTYALVDKREDGEIEGWIVFPFDKSADGKIETAEDNVLRILQAIGENPNREGLIETPRRYMKFLEEFLHPAPFNNTVFDGEGYDEMVAESKIPFFSLCEHHMLPFVGTAAIGYIPRKKIIGLSKLPRTVEHFARRLQNQERLTQQIARHLADTLETSDVAVCLSARHSCMEMRGIKSHGVHTTTSSMLGKFREDAKARSEFFALIKQ